MSAKKPYTASDPPGVDPREFAPFAMGTLGSTCMRDCSRSDEVEQPLVKLIPLLCPSTSVTKMPIERVSSAQDGMAGDLRGRGVRKSMTPTLDRTGPKLRTHTSNCQSMLGSRFSFKTSSAHPSHPAPAAQAVGEPKLKPNFPLPR
eukprot:s2667_g4.t1